MIVRYHHIADRIVALDISQSLAIDKKVFANLLNIAKPVSPILNRAVIICFHYKCRRDWILIITTLDCRRDVFYTLLAMGPAYYHLFDQLSRRL